ncbi:MAG: arylsulfatase [Pseudomonadota bacterium]|nr:arylsulfatase [Pseudomonadota bacterium]
MSGSLALAQDERPNILLIVADDLGYTDIGAYGGEIRTPNIDELADRSVKFTNFHVMPACAPTRAVLLSGADNHTAGLGSMFGPNFLPAVEGRVGYELYLHERVATLPELLTDAGYHTYMAGKWHLGSDQGQWPVDRGFEESFALLRGAGDHFQIGENQYVENNYWVEPRSEGFYSTEAYTDILISNIAEHHDDGRPFFAYAAYTSPHWPLQVPDDYLDRYAGVYDEGYDVLRSQRMARAAELNVIPQISSDTEFERVGAAWDELDADAQRHYARRMEIYAAMVENLDFHVGRLIDYLDSIGELDQTIILFMSDNGAESDEMELNPTFANIIRRRGLDNSLEKLGTPDSYIAYGPGWAQAGTAPFNRFKGFVNEGGTRVPAFLLHGSGSTQVRLDDQYLSAIDIAPTIVELAGTQAAGEVYRGRNVAPMEGRSFARILAGESQPIYDANDTFVVELHGGRSVRRGQYKLVWEQPPGNTWWGYPMPDTWYRWRLFDLETDPSEANDIIATHPQLVQELIAAWGEFAEEYGVVRDNRISNFERWTTKP